MQVQYIKNEMPHFVRHQTKDTILSGVTVSKYNNSLQKAKNAEHLGLRFPISFLQMKEE